MRTIKNIYERQTTPIMQSFRKLPWQSYQNNNFVYTVPHAPWVNVKFQRAIIHSWLHVTFAWLHSAFHSFLTHAAESFFYKKQQIPWSITSHRRKNSTNRKQIYSRNKCKRYLCHIDERSGTVVLPHASSSSQPEVKVHATGAPQEPLHIRLLCLPLWSLTTSLWGRRSVSACLSLIVKSFASCVSSKPAAPSASPHTQIPTCTTLPRPEVRSQAALLCAVLAHFCPVGERPP